MKLYATVQSERASKGQGGKYLNIEIKNEKKEVVSRMIVIDTGDEIKTEMVLFQPYRHITHYYSKGKQNGNITCECGNKFYGLEGKEDTCPKCLKPLIKAKQKDDDIQLWGCKTCGKKFKSPEQLENHLKGKQKKDEKNFDDTIYRNVHKL